MESPGTRLSSAILNIFGIAGVASSGRKAWLTVNCPLSVADPYLPTPCRHAWRHMASSLALARWLCPRQRPVPGPLGRPRDNRHLAFKAVHVTPPLFSDHCSQTPRPHAQCGPGFSLTVLSINSAIDPRSASAPFFATSTIPWFMSCNSAKTVLISPIFLR